MMSGRPSRARPGDAGGPSAAPPTPTVLQPASGNPGHGHRAAGLRDDASRLLPYLHGGVMVLSGAGISTDSGIPDYRGPHARPHVPMTFADFVGSEAARRRYWARSYRGWPVVRRALPNPAHHAVEALRRLGVVESLVTQNVDGLHAHAGSTETLELHGSLSRVVCLDCEARSTREEVQGRLAAANPGVATGTRPPPRAGGNDSRTAHTSVRTAAIQRRPDGDAVLPVQVETAFVVPGCRACGGRLKPDVTFFGESVPAVRAAAATESLDCASAVLVLGSSLTVYSGRRLVRRAARQGKPVLVVNRGPTRGDDLATVKVDAGTSATLDSLRRAIGA